MRSLIPCWQRVPNSLAALGHLEGLGLHDNPGLVSPPRHVVDAGNTAVMRFLARGWRLERLNLCACCSRVFCALKGPDDGARTSAVRAAGGVAGAPVQSDVQHASARARGGACSFALGD